MMMPKKPFIYQGETILFIQTNTVLQEELIDFILKHPIKVIVIERESPDEAPYDTHQRLLSAGVFIVENAIHMNQIPLNQPFKAYIIPLNIHADSSPCRVFVEI
jgi:kynurenine formamidase